MYTNKHILKISAPIFLSLLAQNVIQVVDTAFLGRVGEVELGASALAGIIYIAVYTLAFGFSMGSQILIGRRNGEKQFTKIGDIVIQGIIFLLIPSILIIPAMSFASRHWLTALFHSESISIAVINYLDYRIYGIVFASVNVMFRAFYIGIARTKILTLNALVMTVVNIVFDYGLIFGNFGLPEMGIGGAALASVIAEFSSMIFFIIYTYKKIDLEKYGFKRLNFQWSVVKPVLNISVFMMIQYFLSIATWMLFFVFIENSLGERSLAVSNIVRSFYTILTIPSNAVASTTNTLVSNLIGAGHKNDVLNLVKRVSLMSIGVISVIIILCGIFPETLIRIYTDDASLIQDTVAPFLVLLSALPIYSIGSVIFNAVSGTGNTRSALMFELITLAFYLTYIWYIIIHLQSSVALAWTSEHVYWLFLMILGVIYLRSGKWKKKEI